jgi:hypothetical protein
LRLLYVLPHFGGCDRYSTNSRVIRQQQIIMRCVPINLGDYKIPRPIIDMGSNPVVYIDAR